LQGGSVFAFGKFARFGERLGKSDCNSGGNFLWNCAAAV